VPIRDSDIAGTLRIERRTVIRWRAHLSDAGYITARRTPYGHVYAIQKPKKWKDETGQKCPISAVRDVTQTVHLSGVEMSHTLPGDVTQTDKRCHIPGTNKEEVTREYKEREAHSPDFPPEMEKKIWDCYIAIIEPGPNYSLTIQRKRMLADRHAEMVARGQSPEKAANNLWKAICALSEDDYHMGRKKKYEGRFQNDFKDVFGTQEVFEKWCTIYQANEKAGRV